MVDKNGKLDYRNPMIFISAFKNELYATEPWVVPINLQKCLKGYAASWYTHQLTGHGRICWCPE